MCLLCITTKLPQTTYCERGLAPNFWAEPINALTNITFPIAGYLGYRLLKEHSAKSKELMILPWLLSLVGLGSFIYHTARNSVTLIFDTVPIYIFILYALFLALKELFESKAKASLVLGGFFLLEVILSIYVPKEFLNGSIRHLAAIIFISALGVLLFRKYGDKIKMPIVSVIGLYGFAILFRSIDLTVCNIIPIGTHFLWHTLAAFAGYNAIKLLAVMKSNK